MQIEKMVPSLAAALQPYAWRDDANSIKAKGCHACYEYYYSYARILQPAVVVEIGVQRGYSAISMIIGHPGIKQMHLFDNDADGYQLDTALQQIRQACRHYQSGTKLACHKLDTQEIFSLPVNGMIDFAHIDGQHTYAGCSHDLELVACLVRPGGWLVVDDLWIPEVCRAAQEFAKANADWSHSLVPAHTTHQLSVKPN